eukprot:TRINITY_DN5953_c0_g1_i2.p1 TRINITY_DN5953_c0_g1~~TRINITY_DN5953_c0_g1_i2.p1  ORF type:complete len:136 (-),score=21.55 TRINITY_DN5953_c0_g1_i2:58-465(-)
MMPSIILATAKAPLGRATCLASASLSSNMYAVFLSGSSPVSGSGEMACSKAAEILASKISLVSFSERAGWSSRVEAEASELSATFPVSYTHLRAHETPEHLVCRLLLEKKKKNKKSKTNLIKRIEKKHTYKEYTI